jgi:neutral ceramidase
MKKIITLLGLILVLIPTFVFGKDDYLKANAAVVDLTPPLEMKFSLGGYGERKSKPAEGIHDRIWAKALVLNDGKKKFALVTMDILALPPNVKTAVIEKLSTHGWTLENVLLLSSHTHASLDMSALNDKNILNIPQIGIFQPELLKFVVNKLVEVINLADTELKPVTVGTEKEIVEGLNRNRRGEKVSDKDLTVTRIDLEGGKPLAVLVNWTAHPTIMDDVDMWLSGGWPGYLQRELETWIGDGVVVMYYNGAQGDQSPVAPNGGSHYEQAERYGRLVAKKAYQIYDKIIPKPEPIFNYNYKEITLPKRVAHPLFKATGGAEYNITNEAMEMILGVMCPIKSMSSVLRLGDLMIIGAPGELACQLGLKVKQKLFASGIKCPTIGGFANEWISYILSAEQYEKGGYEASVSFYGPNLGETIVNGMIEGSIPIIE